MTDSTRRAHPARWMMTLAAAGVVLAGCSSASTPSSSATSQAALPSGPAASTAPPAASAAASPAASSSGGVDSAKTLQIAYMSFAVANSYDAPMLAAAQAVASENNAKLTVFDANNDPQKQYSQLQNVISNGQYDGIVVQPISSTGLVDLVKQAIAKGIKVVNIDQIMGTDLSTNDIQVPGLIATVVTPVPTVIGTQMGQLAIKACASKSFNPCNIGYMYDIKASSLDVAIHQAFVDAVKSTPSIKLVAEGQDFFTPSGGLTATQDMLQANPNLSVIVASDQGIEGAVQALTAAKKQGKVLLVGYGASAAGLQGVAAGSWFGTITQWPASEGRIGVDALVKALRSGSTAPATLDLPETAIVTSDNVSQFTGEWPG